MKNIFILLLILVMLGFTSQSQAAKAPILTINDSLKECQIYGPNAREELVDGWRDSGVKLEDMSTAPEKYCTSLGYTLHQDRAVSTVKSIFKVINIIFLVIFMSLIYFYYRIFLRVKRKYVIFLLCILATTFFLAMIVHPFVIYQISPCASGWAIC